MPLDHALQISVAPWQSLGPARHQIRRNAEQNRNWGTATSMPTVLAAPAFQWSDLAKKPTEVGKALDAAPVMRDMCALLGAVVATETPERVCAILNAAWPWTVSCRRTIRSSRSAAEADHSLRPANPSIPGDHCSTRGTARAWASGASVVGPIANPVNTPVPRP